MNQNTLSSARLRASGNATASPLRTSGDVPNELFAATPRRDLRIDWLRGLAMTCVIINHSKMSSLLSWFSYERFWVVTAAEVFVVLSGVVLGMVYGRRLARDGWLAVARGLTRRALILYVSFIAVTVSLLMISVTGVDVQSLAGGVDPLSDWVTNPRGMDIAAWRDLALMRSGPWPFDIVGLYVWLVAAAVPCLLALQFAGWRPVLAVSWALYLAYRIAPHPLTSAEFEDVFPIPAWQLLFVHGVVIGYYRDRVSAFVQARPTALPIGGAIATAAFLVFALCNPWSAGPSWLHWHVISPDRFSDLYSRYFGLSNLGAGRLLNLAVALPLGYGVLTWCWKAASRLAIVFVTLGQQSLSAFVLHVYALVILQHLPRPNNLWLNTFVQIAIVVAIAGLLNGIQRLSIRPRRASLVGPQRLAA